MADSSMCLLHCTANHAEPRVGPAGREMKIGIRPDLEPRVADRLGEPARRKRLAQLLLRETAGAIARRFFIAEAGQEQPAAGLDDAGQSSHVLGSIFVGKDMEQSTVDGRIELLRQVVQVRRVHHQKCRGDCTFFGFAPGLGNWSLQEMLSREVPGDWTVRDVASPAKRLAALQAVLRDELKLPVRFVQREVEREVIVASGRYEFLPLSGVRDREHIILAVEEAPDTSMGGTGSGSLGDLLRWLGGRLNRHVIDETDGAKGQKLRWRDHLVSHMLDFANRTEAGGQKLERLLFNLNQQTALRFTLEPRNVKAWFVEQAADGKDDE